ncbi:hypothetical protein BKA69DRAFT_897438 [Paraphysoderma sedebokerense]|nr:hypothetical protein BKA69DRAFT_897438 [Paraphysoderma sedebokerense]
MRILSYSSFALVNILINFLQTIWILRKVRLDWPPELLRIIDYFSIFNLNVEFVSPECVIQTPLNFSQKLRMILALPIVLLIATLLVIVLFTILKAVRNFIKPKRRDSNVGILTLRGKQPADSTSFGLVMMKMFNASLSILYIHLAAKSLALFDCSFEEDGKAYLDDEVSLLCYTDWWDQDLPFGVASILYVHHKLV